MIGRGGDVAALELLANMDALLGERSVEPDRLFELERLCWKVLSHSTGDLKAVAFALAAFLDMLARRQNGEAMTVGDARRIKLSLDGPARKCADYLHRPEVTTSSPIDLIEGLADAYDAIRSKGQ